MQLWEFIIPREDNEGRPLDQAHQAFGRWLADLFHGFTRSDVFRVWENEGKTYQERAYSYRVLSNWEPTLDVAFELFPDQLALYKAQIGTGEIVERPS